MQLFFIATWKSAILVSTAAAVVSCCYGYNSFLLVNKSGLLLQKYQYFKALLKLFPGFFSNMRNKIAHTEGAKIAMSVLTH
jgi:hypothetical protein